MKLTAKIFLALLIFATTSCSKTYLPTGPEIDASIATTQWLDNKYGIVSDRDMNKMLTRVKRRLGAALYGTALEREIQNVPAAEFANFPWQIYVLDTNTAQAFSSGAGTIFLSKGFIAQTYSEATLAAVISHEMAHLVLGHTKKAISSTGLSDQAPKFSFSLRDEIDADSLSLKIMRVARYDLRHSTHALSLSYRVTERGVSRPPPEWLAKRMTNLQQQLHIAKKFLPATQTTREFTRVRDRLRNG